MLHRPKRLLSLLVPIMMLQTAHAEQVVDLGILKVDVAQPLPTPPQTVNLNQETLQQKLITDNKELVRYNTEVSLAQDGRFGLGGLAMQGVDENRVAVVVDGVGVPNIEKQLGVFNPYGWMYGGRAMLDTALAGKVTLKGGADALNFGGGAIGGAISYQTKDPKELVKEGNLGGYVSTGYASRNSEKRYGAGVAGVSDTLEFVVDYSQRHGKETKNHENLTHNADKFKLNYTPSSVANVLDLVPNYNVGNAATTPDPVDSRTKGVVAKLYYKPTINHRVGLHLLSQKNDTKVAQASYQLPSQIGGQAMFVTNDSSDWQKYGLSYEYTPNSSVITKASINVDHQDRKALAVQTKYRDGLDITRTTRPHFNEHKIRPSTESSNQLRVGVDFGPIDLLGEHRFSVAAGFAKKDASNEILDERICTHKTVDSQGRSIQDRWCLGQESYRIWEPIMSPNVKTKTAYAAIKDNITFGERADAELGVRYDRYSYTPYFTEAQMEALGKRAADRWTYGLLLPESPRDTPEDKVKRAKFQKEYYDKAFVTRDNVSFGAKVGYRFAPDWYAQTSVNKGFMMPTASHLYSIYEGFDSALVPGYLVGLRPEQSLTKNIAIDGRMQDVQVHFGAYHTKYKDLIEYNPLVYQFANTPSAQSYGGTVALDYRLPLRTMGQWSLVTSYTKEKSKTFNGGNLLATQPDRAVFGVDYVTPKGDVDIHARASWQDRKRYSQASFKTVKGQEPDKDDKGNFKLLDYSRPHTVFDIYATKRIGDHFSVSAGVYNVFNKKYHTWDSLRAVTKIRDSGTDKVDSDFVGLERYTAPGRNWAVSANYRF